MTIPQKCPSCGAGLETMLSSWHRLAAYTVDYGARYKCGAVFSIQCQKRQKRKAKK